MKSKIDKSILGKFKILNGKLEKNRVEIKIKGWTYVS